jgi:hypothetical protein
MSQAAGGSLLSVTWTSPTDWSGGAVVARPVATPSRSYPCLLPGAATAPRPPHGEGRA